MIPNTPCMVYLPTFGYIWVVYGVNVGKYSSTMEHVGMVYSLRVGHVSLPCSTVGEIATRPMGSWSLTVGSWHVVFSGEDSDLTWFFHIHIIIHLYQLYIYNYILYINLYINLYHSTSYIYVHGFWIAVVLPVRSLPFISNSLAFCRSRLLGLRHRYGCAKSVKIIWHGQADTAPVSRCMAGDEPSKK